MRKLELTLSGGGSWATLRWRCWGRCCYLDLKRHLRLLCYPPLAVPALWVLKRTAQPSQNTI